MGTIARCLGDQGEPPRGKSDKPHPLQGSHELIACFASRNWAPRSSISTISHRMLLLLTGITCSLILALQTGGWLDTVVQLIGKSEGGSQPKQRSNIFLFRFSGRERNRAPRRSWNKATPANSHGPKQLIPIANKPVSQYGVEDMIACGIREI